MKKSIIKKNIGLKKTLSFLSILPFDLRFKIISHLSIFEQKRIYKLSDKFGGFSQIKNTVNIEKLKHLSIDLNKIKNKKNILKSLDLFLTFIFFIFGIIILIINFFNSTFDLFLSFFITIGYATIFAPILIFILLINNKFSWKLNFTNSSSILRHTVEGLISSILLIIILMQINAVSENFNKTDINIFFIIYSSFFIPFLEELLYRYILMTLILRKTDRFIRIILSAVIFGFMHFPFISILTLLLYLLSGLILSLLYGVENYLLPTFLAHCIANLVIFLI